MRVSLLGFHEAIEVQSYALPEDRMETEIPYPPLNSCLLCWTGRELGSRNEPPTHSPHGSLLAQVVGWETVVKERSEVWSFKVCGWLKELVLNPGSQTNNHRRRFLYCFVALAWPPEPKTIIAIIALAKSRIVYPIL